MSQSGAASSSGSGADPIETLTGNSGGPVGPDASFNINVIGNNTTGINIVGSPGANTLTVVGIQATTTQRGTVTLATNAETIAGTDTSKVITPDDLKAKLGTQTAHSLAVFEGTTSALTALGAATNGQLPIGSTGADPVLAALTAGSGISVTNGAGSITLAVNGSSVVQTLTGNSGGAISPTAGNINTLGTGSITIAGSGSTLTTQLTGLTNHAVLVGAGTATITNITATANTGAVLQNNSGADPSYSTATYPSTTTINQILYSSAANTVAGLATANQGVLTTGATGIPVITALATNGQVIIGSTAGVPAAATLTAGTGISITNGSNSITIATIGGGVTWSDQSGSFTAVVGNGYFLTAASTPLLPASPSEGDTVYFICDTASTVTVTGNTGQKIRIGAVISGAAGTAASSTIGNSLALVYRTTGTTWISLGAPEGTWTVT